MLPNCVVGVRMWHTGWLTHWLVVTLPRQSLVRLGQANEPCALVGITPCITLQLCSYPDAYACCLACFKHNHCLPSSITAWVKCQQQVLPPQSTALQVSFWAQSAIHSLLLPAAGPTAVGFQSVRICSALLISLLPRQLLPHAAVLPACLGMPLSRARCLH